MRLRQQLIRLAYQNPAMRGNLLPLLCKTATLDKVAVKVQQFKNMLSKPGQFGILTAYGPGSKSENKRKQTELIQELQKRGYRFEHLKGEWEGIGEQSLLVPDMKAKDLYDLGRKYSQISVIHKNSSGVVGMYYLKENKVEVAIKPDKSIAGQIEKGKTLWSKSRGNSFTFDFLWGQKMPWDGKTSVPYKQVSDWVSEGKIKPHTEDSASDSDSSESGDAKESKTVNWDEFIKQEYGGLNGKVPNTNQKTRDRYPEVTVSTLMQSDPNFYKKLKQEYSQWANT